MSMTRLATFARKYGKRVGGNLILEGCIAGNQILNHEDLDDVEVPDQIVTLSGYIEFNEAKQRKTGKEGTRIRTGYVTGLAINDGQLFAITVDSVYRLHGPWMADVITENPYLKSLWDDVKGAVLAQATKKA